MSSSEYATRTLAMGEKARKDIDGLMAGDKLDLIAGTHLAVPFTIYYPGAGYPAVAIQAGYRADGAPVGFVLTGKLFDDARLIRAAYALEQATKAWRAPDLAKWK
jgi:Asp-tRNA(Asn)/Glu-tRNA(Gln) amidotransferase A subunit family amidase